MLIGLISNFRNFSECYERWTDKAALQVHMTTPHIKGIGPKLEPVLAKPFTQIFLGAVSGA
jgi:quinol monooxygenase YgiN